MRKNLFPGRFFVLEGLDGSGQDTQGKLLEELLVKNGRQAILTNEPTYDGEVGKRIRRILRGEETIESPLEFQKLYVKDRR